MLTTEESLEMIADHVAKLGEELGLPDFEFKEGYACLESPSGPLLHLILEGESFTLLCEMGELPRGEERLPFLEGLLEANALWIGTLGATLSVNQTKNQVMLARRWSIWEIDHLGLKQPLETFVEAIACWWDAIQEGSLDALIRAAKEGASDENEASDSPGSGDAEPGIRA